MSQVSALLVVESLCEFSGVLWKLGMFAVVLAVFLNGALPPFL